MPLASCSRRRSARCWCSIARNATARRRPRQSCGSIRGRRFSKGAAAARRRLPPLPPVRDAAWASNEIDRFILARLEERGLSPAPRAEKRTLLRRLTFDLIGLPPTPEEVEKFVQDDSPQAWAKVVDRLLASPHYG